MRTLFILISALIIGYLSNSFVWAGQLPNNGSFLQDDLLNGPKKEYYPNGKVCKEYTLKDGKIEGVYKFYSTLGKLVSEQYFKDGEPNGFLKTYYENGQLKSEGNMKPGGDISGQAREYYEDGTLKSESMISGVAPELSTQSKTYSKEGKLLQESSVSNGEFVYSISYDDQGRVTCEQKPGQIISYWYERDTGKKHTSINGVEQK
jgi:antitoxin component YwqK of YwqJK toxin-antitoxin module